MSQITLQDIEKIREAMRKQAIPGPYYVFLPGSPQPTNEDWLIWLFSNEFNVRSA